MVTRWCSAPFLRPDQDLDNFLLAFRQGPVNVTPAATHTLPPIPTPQSVRKFSQLRASKNKNSYGGFSAFSAFRRVRVRMPLGSRRQALFNRLFFA